MKPLPVIPWTRNQRQALIVVLGVCLAGFTARYLFNRQTVDDPQPDRGALADELADRLDPNVADWQELAAIPGLGEKRAQAIVAYREKWQTAHPGDRAFRGPQDLRQVKGIGPATVDNLVPNLSFPPSPAGREVR